MLTVQRRTLEPSLLCGYSVLAGAKLTSAVATVPPRRPGAFWWRQ